MSYQIIQDDILNWAGSYNGPKFHCIMCDPPYHLTSITKRFGKENSAPAKTGVYNRGSKGFMGQQWDGGDIAFNPETWQVFSQHLYPGGFIMAFAGTRGYHRMAVAMEDSGLIIHPAMIWVNLSGFPKATNISLQCEQKLCYCVKTEDKKEWFYRDDDEPIRTSPPFRSEKANLWWSHRYGLQALKPCLEFLAVAQKPYEGRPVDCITRTGAGAWNIDAGRIPTGDNLDGGGYMTPVSEGWDRPWRHNEDIREEKEQLKNERVAAAESLGRWPANLILSEEGAEALDRQSGILKSGGPAKGRDNIDRFWTDKKGQADNPELYNGGDSGGASRMFFKSHWAYEVFEQLQSADPLKYEPKVSTTEREAGLDSLPLQQRNRVNSGGLENDPKFAPTKMKNHHPTLKPISLTKYLATLLLPPDAYAPRRILVPFAGSGSEAIGCVLAGWEEVVIIEKSTEYTPIADARLKWWSQWPGWGQTEVDKILSSLESKSDENEQLNFFDV